MTRDLHKVSNHSTGFLDDDDQTFKLVYVVARNFDLHVRINMHCVKSKVDSLMMMTIHSKLCILLQGSITRYLTIHCVKSLVDSLTMMTIHSKL